MGMSEKLFDTGDKKICEHGRGYGICRPCYVNLAQWHTEAVSKWQAKDKEISKLRASEGRLVEALAALDAIPEAYALEFQAKRDEGIVAKANREALDLVDSILGKFMWGTGTCMVCGEGTHAEPNCWLFDLTIEIEKSRLSTTTKGEG